LRGAGFTGCGQLQRRAQALEGHARRRKLARGLLACGGIAGQEQALGQAPARDGSLEGRFHRLPARGGLPEVFGGSIMPVLVGRE